MTPLAKRFLIVLLLVALAALPALAKPNFGGDWKLNAAKSDFGPFPAPSSMTQSHNHEDPTLKATLKMSTDNGDFTWEATYKTDGTETSNQFGPSEMKSKAVWQEDTLCITSKGQFGDNAVTLDDKWDLSPDGKTLTIRRKWSSQQGEAEQKIVFDKQ